MGRDRILSTPLRTELHVLNLLTFTLVIRLQQSTAPAKNGTNNAYEVVSTVTDRSDLSDEMASLCAKLPIYRVKKATAMSRRKCYTVFVQ